MGNGFESQDGSFFSREEGISNLRVVIIILTYLKNLDRFCSNLNYLRHHMPHYQLVGLGYQQFKQTCRQWWCCWVTRRINGGTNGLDDRKHNLEMMKNYYHKIYLLVKVSIFNKTRIWITLNEMNSWVILIISREATNFYIWQII
jgi:hypothetical protein